MLARRLGAEFVGTGLASTSFANPAVTLARTLTDTFDGIAPASVAPFIAAQFIAALAATALGGLVISHDHRCGRGHGHPPIGVVDPTEANVA